MNGISEEEGHEVGILLGREAGNRAAMVNDDLMKLVDDSAPTARSEYNHVIN